MLDLHARQNHPSAQPVDLNAQVRRAVRDALADLDVTQEECGAEMTPARTQAYVGDVLTGRVRDLKLCQVDAFGRAITSLASRLGRSDDYPHGWIWRKGGLVSDRVTLNELIRCDPDISTQEAELIIDTIAGARERGRIRAARRRN